MTDASITRRPSTPRTRSAGSTTAAPSEPIRHVPAGWCAVIAVRRMKASISASVPTRAVAKYRPDDQIHRALLADLPRNAPAGAGDAARDRGDADAVGEDDLLGSPGSAGSAGLGLGSGRCGRTVRARLHAPDHLADVHGVAGLREDLLHHARRGRRDLGVDLVGGDLDDRLVLVDPVARLLRPLEDDALGDRLAHRGHHDLDRLGRRPPAACFAPPASGARGAVAARRRPARSPRAARRRSRCRPRSAWTLTTVPVAGEGTSASTLSVEISTIVSSSETESPSCLCHSRMVPSETESPIAGMTTWTVVSTAIWVSQDTFSTAAPGDAVLCRTRRSST